MSSKYSGIESRLQRLKSCLQKLEPLRVKTRNDIDNEPYLKDIIERNFEVAAQCIIDIANRIISEMEGEKPTDYLTAILIIGDLKVLPVPFAKHIAPLAGLRNILVHQYLDVDWNIIYDYLHNLSDFYQFVEYIETWMSKQSA